MKNKIKNNRKTGLFKKKTTKRVVISFDSLGEHTRYLNLIVKVLKIFTIIVYLCDMLTMHLI